MWTSCLEELVSAEDFFVAQDTYGNRYTSSRTAKIWMAMQQTWEEISSEGLWERLCSERFTDAEGNTISASSMNESDAVENYSN